MPSITISLRGLASSPALGCSAGLLALTSAQVRLALPACPGWLLAFGPREHHRRQRSVHYSKLSPPSDLFYDVKRCAIEFSTTYQKYFIFWVRSRKLFANYWTPPGPKPQPTRTIKELAEGTLAVFFLSISALRHGVLNLANLADFCACR